MSKPPTTDAANEAQRLIPRERIDAPLHIAPYDPDWPQTFEAEAARMRAALGPAAVAMHHAGSTSVPGLAAKPLIDVVLGVPDPAAEVDYIPALEAIGYVFHAREPGWFEHRLLKHAKPPVNLHVFAADCPEIGRMLVFRDWLRAHEDDRRLYETTKRALAARTWTYVQDYADAKTQVVLAIMARASAG